MDIIDIVS